MSDWSAMRVDAHSHLPLDTDEASAIVDALDLRIINICVDSAELGGLDAQRAWYRGLTEQRPDRFGWVTSFALDEVSPTGPSDQLLAQLEEDLTKVGGGGGSGVKVWKNVGMEVRDGEGRFVFCDDERFDPIYAQLAEWKVPLLMHIGEPLACWQSLERMRADGSPHYDYYRANPQWHWCGKADVPSHAELVASRDRVCAKHPGLTVVGAHYGSLEYDVDAVAERFGRYPNFHVDTSARLGDLAMQVERDRGKVVAFFEAFSDRILWGLDWVMTRPLSEVATEERASLVERVKKAYETEFRFFATEEPVAFPGRTVRGLDLSKDVWRQLIWGNAQRVYGAFA